MSFERLKTIGGPTKNLINGFIRNCQNELFGEIAADNPYYNIPPLINKYCILFYELFRWYKQSYGDGLKFISDTEVTVQEKDIDHRRWLTCIFENVISDTFCNKFSITFKIKSYGKTSIEASFNLFQIFILDIQKQIQ